MKKALLASALSALLLTGAAQAETRIGVSMTSFDNPFLTILLNGIRAQAAKEGDVKLVVEDAQLDVARQLNQVQNFVSNKVDAIIVNAVDGDSTAAITKSAVKAGIPIIYVNHPPMELDKGMPAGTAYVGSDEEEAGRLQAQAVCAALKGRENSRAVILMGPLENRAALVRTRMVEDAFRQPDCKVEVVEKQVANWSRVQGQDLVAAWLTAGLEFDAIVANNDEMAIGAAQAMAAGGGDDEVIIAGLDATTDGLAALASGRIDITVYQNATNQGEVAVQTAVAAAKGQKIKSEYWVPFQPVDKDNMKQFMK